MPQSRLKNLDTLFDVALARLQAKEQSLERLAIDIEVTGQVQPQIATDEEREVVALCVALARITLIRRDFLNHHGIEPQPAPSRN